MDEPWPGAEKLDDEITWVSLLLDLKRGDAGNSEFRRSMDEYYARFQRILDRGFKMVIFIPKEFESHLKIDSTSVYDANKYLFTILCAVGVGRYHQS